MRGKPYIDKHIALDIHQRDPPHTLHVRMDEKTKGSVLVYRSVYGCHMYKLETTHHKERPLKVPAKQKQLQRAIEKQEFRFSHLQLFHL